MKKGGKMATVRQIAKLADVSPATVSRVLNNYEHVRPDVRARVIRAARELGGFRDSRNIAVLIASDAAFWSYSGIMLSALLAELRKRGYHEIIVTENSANLLHEHLLDGAISMLLHDGIEQVWDEKQAIPLICINACPRHISGIYSVFSNDRQGVWLALDHLHGLGHIRIAYLANEPRRMLDNSNSGRRLEAYRQRNRLLLVPARLPAGCRADAGAARRCNPPRKTDSCLFGRRDERASDLVAPPECRLADSGGSFACLLQKSLDCARGAAGTDVD